MPDTDRTAPSTAAPRSHRPRGRWTGGGDGHAPADSARAVFAVGAIMALTFGILVTAIALHL